METDKRGLFDRTCPQCRTLFKISLDEIGQDDEAYCPSCGYRSVFDDFDTEEHRVLKEEAAKACALNIGLDIIRKELGTGFKDDFISLVIRYPEPEPIPPIVQTEPYRFDTMCPDCGIHYAVLGPANYCPGCGMNTSVRNFYDQMDRVYDMVRGYNERLDDPSEMLSPGERAKLILETNHGLEMMVSVYQAAASKVFTWFSDTQAKNLFQRFDESMDALAKETGMKVEDWVSEDDATFMRRMFMARHIIEHNDSIVDDDYVRRSGDKTIPIGRRYRVRTEDCFRFKGILLDLVDHMVGLATEKGYSEAGREVPKNR